jgi:hypothetical protein
LGAQLELLQRVPEHPAFRIAGQAVIRGEQAQQLPAERIRKKSRHEIISTQYRDGLIALCAISIGINR